jgi:hypothetical protein
MNIAHYEMLKELGINIEKPVEPKEIIGELRDERNCTYYTSDYIDKYGAPWGTEFYVVESRDLDIGTEYTPEAGKTRRPHIYNRITRFKFCLLYITGQSGYVPDEIIYKIAQDFGVLSKLKQYVNKRLIKCCYKFKRFSDLKYDSKTIWGIMRKYLKKQKLGLYYNRIPYILYKLGVPHPNMSEKKYAIIMDDFQKLHDNFDAKKLGIKYFPDLRYVVLRLLDIHRVELKYDIPLLNTRRLLPKINSIFELMYASIQ